MKCLPKIMLPTVQTYNTYSVHETIQLKIDILLAFASEFLLLLSEHLYAAA
jgi:hypothetical protein